MSDIASGPAKEKLMEVPAVPTRRRRFAPVLVLLVIVIAVGGVFYYQHARQFESTDDAFIEAPVVPISARVAGHVARVLVQDNQQVQAGQPLVELDDADYVARVQSAQAALAYAEASLLQARADAVVAEAQLERSNAEMQRIESLRGTGSASPQELTNVSTAHRSAVATLDAARKRASATEAGVQQAQAQLRQAELNLSYTRVTAPQAGLITRKVVEPGQYVQVGQNLLAIVPPERWVVANFKETQLAHMRPGQPVTVEIDSLPGRQFKAHVDSIQAGSGARFSLLPPENATGNFVKVVQRVPVKIVFDEPPATDRPLGPGLSVVPTVKVRD